MEYESETGINETVIFDMNMVRPLGTLLLHSSITSL